MPQTETSDPATLPAIIPDEEVDRRFSEITAGEGHGPCVCDCRGCGVECPNKATRSDGLCNMCRPFFDPNAASMATERHCHFIYGLMGGSGDEG